MYDMHSHILHGVDDGAGFIGESVQMAAQAAACGMKAIIATPHYIEGLYVNDYKKNLACISRLRQELDKAGIVIDIYPGNEVHITPEILKLVKSGKIAALNGSRYVLIELPFLYVPYYTEKVIFDMEIEGYKAVLAHPERNEHIIKDLNILNRFIKQGALVQINLSSLAGLYGRHSKKAAFKMLKLRMVHFVGTDAHSPQEMQAGLNTIREILEVQFPDQSHNLLYKNPESIINNKPL